MNRANRDYNILIIEDNPGDFALVEEFLLEQIDSPKITHTESYRATAEILVEEKCKFDIILLDLSLPDKTGESLIKEIVNLCSNIPIIVLTGYADFDFGVKSLSLGISDYLLKEELTSISLFKSIIYSFERKKAIASLEESEKRYSELFHLSPLPMWVLEIGSLQFLDVNQAAITNYGYSRNEFLCMTIGEIESVGEVLKPVEELAGLKDHEQLLPPGYFKHKKKNGDTIVVDVQSNSIDYQGKEAMITLSNDVTERLNYIKAIEDRNKKLTEISWIQSHVIRAPLVRIMGLIPLLTEIKDNEDEKLQMLKFLQSSANDLDNVIRNISNITNR